MERQFRRSFDSLHDIFDFLDLFFALEKVDTKHRYGMYLAAEEFFTNMVKYNSGDAPGEICIEIARTDDQLRLALTDFNVDPFDVTKARPVPKDTPLEVRRRGGLGLQIVREMMDSVTYDYFDKRSRVTVVKNLE
jgi:anti-sigma regulatory factor (Ser/Thr protein kinase)